MGCSAFEREDDNVNFSLKWVYQIVDSLGKPTVSGWIQALQHWQLLAEVTLVSPQHLHLSIG